MEEIAFVIEKGIPIPKRAAPRWRGGNWIENLRRMEIGDSALIPVWAISGINACSKRLGMKLRYHRQLDGINTRIWLVGKATP